MIIKITFALLAIGLLLAYYVYILASGRRGTLYIGVTNDLVRRVYEHRTIWSAVSRLDTAFIALSITRSTTTY